MLLELKQGIIYGPVRSRRLGHSLGINLLPARAKVCTFNCLYCQYGWTDFAALGGLVARGGPVAPGVAAGSGLRGAQELAAHGLPTAEQVGAAVEQALRAADAPPAFITFSGNGEPTLHPDFAGAVDRVIAARNRLAPSARVAILSNSTTAGDPTVRAALARLDVRIMKLDVGTPEALRSYNQPAPGIALDSILAGLGELGDVTLQVLLAGGPRGNAQPAEIEAWIDRVVSLSPRRVQIYTLARGYPSGEICALERGELESIGRSLGEAGVRNDIF